MSRQAQKSGWQRLLLGIAVAAPVVMASAIAAPPATGLGPDARLISDDELGEMRGRYIEPESVNFFGIQMLSAWQTSDGNVLTASLEFEVNLTEGQWDDDAQLLANWSNGDPTLDIPVNSTPAGLTTVSGAVQANEISGDDNNTLNVMRVRIGDFDADSVGFDGNVNSEEITSEGMSIAYNGFLVRFEKGANSLGMILQAPGAEGQAVQSIDANQIAQNLQIMGNAHAVQNTLDVFIGVDQLLTTQVAVDNALSTMKGWGF